MKRILAPRASAILYSLLRASADRRPFLLPANICPIVPITFLKAGKPFEFVDISPTTLNMDADAALSRVRSRPAAGVLCAHTYGDPAVPLDFFEELKRIDPSLLLIDDRCLCIPDLEAGPLNPVDVLLYSTGYAKIVDLGFGGYAFLPDDLDYQAASLPYSARDLEQLEEAYKQAVENRARFKYVDSEWLQTGSGSLTWDSYSREIDHALPLSLEHRGEINEIYSSALPAEVQLPARFQLWRFQIRVPDRKRVLDAIFSRGLFASAHYASLAGIMGPGHCPEAERLAAGVVNLFNDHHYTAAMAEETAEIVLRCL